MCKEGGGGGRVFRCKGETAIFALVPYHKFDV